MSLPTLSALLALATGQAAFVHWETPHVHPLERTPDGTRLLAVNLPDARLEVLALGAAGPTHELSIPVGLDPLSVRARTDGEAWVVNHVSDSVSVVDLVSGNVVATLATDDEPADVVFAGSPQRAFVTCSQANTLLVFDPSDLGQAPLRVPLRMEEPRALAVAPDGSVWIAAFESGNRTTLLGGGATTPFFPPNVVGHPAGPYGGVNPPPNAGAGFEPPLAPGLPPPPAVGLVVRQRPDGSWRDDNDADWSDLVSGPLAPLGGRPVGYTLLDHDLAALDPDGLAVTYVDHLMHLVTALAVHPSGVVSAVGTDATNEVRYVPNLRGRFVRSEIALVEPVSGARLVADLNPHLDYAAGTVGPALRARTLADPRGIVWSADGTRAWVSGQSSDRVLALDALGRPVGPPIEVGEGPTGLALDEARGLLYVLNKRGASLSVVSLASAREVKRLALFDPTPAAVRAGRAILYDARASGLGLTACSACHVDARSDRLAWDLGDPEGAVAPLAGNLGANLPGVSTGFEDWHPMKGPMLTMSLVDVIGHEPFHWRGDRAGLDAFAPAFVELLGADEEPSAGELARLRAFLGSIHTPPNPFRTLENELPTTLPLPGHTTSGELSPPGQPLPDGDATRGEALFFAALCSACHTRDTGYGTDATFVGGAYVPLPTGPSGEHHHMLVPTAGFTNVTIKVPQLRNLYERVGADFAVPESQTGFGFMHDGSVDSLSRFVSLRHLTDEQQVADLIAFLLCYSGGSEEHGTTANLFDPPSPPGQATHAAVGRQVTFADGPPDPTLMALLQRLLDEAERGRIGLVAKGRRDGEARGWVLRRGSSGRFQSDRAREWIDLDALLAGAGPGSELTFTAVPFGTQRRMGVDRDADGWLDRDELDRGNDPADPGSVPRGERALGPLRAAGPAGAR